MPAAAKSKSRRKSTRGRNPQWITLRSQGLFLVQARSLASLPRIVHAFTTRPGGASSLVDSRAKSKSSRNSPEKVLNLGFTDWDTRENVLENRARLLSALGVKNLQLVTLKQIHSDIIYVFNSAPAEVLQGDSVITAIPGLLLAAQTADCIPILLADPQNRVVAAIHSGWRGTLRRLAAKTVGRMQMVFGTRPADVIAAIGPGIGRCCYEVGVEVVKEFAAQFPQAADWFSGPYEQLSTGEEPNPFLWLSMSPPGHEPPPPTAQLDLIAANRAILQEAGVPSRNITASELCTSCRTEVLFSHRREAGRTGRQLAVIGIR